jgi:hypothetical protein
LRILKSWAAVLPLLMFLLDPPVARADQTIATEAMSQPGAPIQFKCVAGYADAYTLGFDFAFKITGDQPAVAVKMAFDAYDAFDNKLGTTSADKTGYFSPDTVIMPNVGKVSMTEGLTGPWEYKYSNIWPSLQRMTCRAEEIRWADGTIWTATATVASTTPDPAAELLAADKSACGNLWMQRFTFSNSDKSRWKAIGDTCAMTASGLDSIQHFTAAARDHARSYVAYMKAHGNAAPKQRSDAVNDLNVGHVSADSKLFALITSATLSTDGGAIDSPLNDAP